MHSEYFEKNNNSYIVLKDIYNKDGLLLIKKGEKVSSRIKSKLQSIGIYDSKNQESPNNISEDSRIPNINEIQERKNFASGYSFEKAYRILFHIIFKSKNKPWWIFVNTLSNFIDWIYTHSINVAIISLMMGIELKYNDDELFSLGLGAFFHDVGLLMVPETLLKKEEILSAEESSILHQHCRLGVMSLLSFQIPETAITIIMQHHERLDGSGYPEGLTDTQISKEAKIVIIADIIDNMTSWRPQNPNSLEMQEAIQLIYSTEEKYPCELLPVLEKIVEL